VYRETSTDPGASIVLDCAFAEPIMVRGAKAEEAVPEFISRKGRPRSPQRP